jgi:hypothetical protein
MALGSTQAVLKMSTRNIHGAKGGRCIRLTTLPPLRAEYHEIWEPKPPGTLSATPGLLRDSLKHQQVFYGLSLYYGFGHEFNQFSRRGRNCKIIENHLS